MSDDIVERLRATGCDAEPFTAEHRHCKCRLANEAANEIERLRERVAKLEDRLEITHVWNGKGARVAVPPEKRDTIPDGIDCRDETIRLLENRIQRLTSDGALDRKDYLEARVGSLEEDAERHDERISSARAQAFEEAAKIANEFGPLPHGALPVDPFECARHASTSIAAAIREHAKK